jgi:hypothetical protein
MNLVALQILAKLLTLPGFDGVFAEPYLRCFRLAPGEKYATGDAYIVGFQVDSNEKHPIVDYRGWVIHRLADPADSETYCNGEMLADIEMALDPKSSDGFLGVVEVLELGLPSPVRRVGDIIEYEIVSRLVVDSVS